MADRREKEDLFFKYKAEFIKYRLEVEQDLLK